MTVDHWLKGIIYVGAFLVTLLPLIIIDSLFFPFVTSKVLFFRILVEIIFFVWLVLIIREPNQRPKRGMLLWASIAWIFIASLATLFSLNPTISFWSNFERMEGLVTFSHIFAYFLVLSSVFREKIWFWFLNASLGVSLIVDFIALGEYFNSGTSRVDATLGNPTYLASYLLFHIFVAGLLYKKIKPDYLLLKVFYGATILLNAFVLFQTGTRGTILGLLGGLAGMALIFVLFGKDHKKERRWAIFVLACLFLLIGGFLLIKDTQVVQNNPTLSRLASISLEDNTTKSRFIIWGMALEGFKERPIFGWGFENFSVVFNKYYNPELYDQEQWFDRAHNVFFDWLIGAGVLGLLSYLFLFASALFVLFKSDNFSLFEKCIWLGFLLAYFIHNLFVFDNIVSYFIFFTVLAYLHTENGQQKVIYSKVVNRPIQHLVAGVSVLLLGITVTFFVFKPMFAAENLITGLRQIDEGVDSNSIEQLDLAKEFFYEAYNQSPTARKQTAEQLLTKSISVVNNENLSPEAREYILSEASDLMKMEIKADPYSARQWLFYGWYLINFNDKEAAINALNRALELSPNKPQILFQMAEGYIKFGDKEKALESSNQAYILAGQFKTAQIHHALVLFRSGERKQAEDLLLEKFNTLAVDDQRLISYYFTIKRFDLLEDIFKKRLESGSGNKTDWYALAATFFERGRINEGIQVLEEARIFFKDQQDVVREINSFIENIK